MQKGSNSQKGKAVEVNAQTRGRVFELAEGGKSTGQIARELTLPDWQIRAILKESKPADSPDADIQAVERLQSEIDRMNLDNSRLQAIFVDGKKGAK